ncbi:hypothetical protein FDA94_28870 [Herbidospora galbida]|uniref:Uncharacterized protein n=1 Tax=Herbidospora galbida TaxID=2575442 RepID=A0A4U3M6T6_9ACTN|nr:hypothetical protein [Herbidospora galbida]TKK84645.1 hypothetical protein FDA94_28870 [Herbidospora galbida]
MPESAANFYLRKSMGHDPIRIETGASGYFSAPEKTLDPHLFNGDRLKGDVRVHLVSTLFAFMATRWHAPHSWARCWLAGSGITYQWSASRGNGDLDVLLGADWVQLRKLNPVFSDMDNADIATVINTELRDHLWPQTALTRFHGQSYEVTYYLNQNSTDIRTIHPYAAYDLISDTWTVRPPKLPHDPAKLYPADWRSQIVREQRFAQDVVDRYNTAATQASRAVPGSGAWTNALSIAKLAVAQAESLYEGIHLGRRNAFAEGGQGYGDWHNYRWQSHKANGVVGALQKITKIGADANAMYQRNVYGHILPDAAASRISAQLTHGATT